MKEKIYNVTKLNRNTSNNIDISLIVVGGILIISLIVLIYDNTNSFNFVSKKEIVGFVNKKPSYEYLKSVTVIMLNKRETGTGLGTGVVVKKNDDQTFVLTNSHICNDTDPCIVKTESNEYTAEIVKRSSIFDLLLVKIQQNIKEKNKINGINYAKPQDAVYTVGHGLSVPYLYGEGTVAGHNGLSLVVSLPTIFGNSGSGVFNTNGDLIGMVFGIKIIKKDENTIIDPGHGYCVDGVDIKMFLDGALK